MESVLDRIAAWQAAGLIDATTADRLRATEGPPAPVAATAPARSSGVASAAGSFFGPTPTIVEMFGYLGSLFLIAAWSTFLARIADGANRDAIMAIGSSVGVAVLLGIGIALRNGDARRRRAGGAAILAATIGAAAAADFIAQALQLDGSVVLVFDASITLGVALVGRVALPSVSTQAAVIGAFTWLGWAVLSLLQPVIGDGPQVCCSGDTEPAADVLRLAILPAIGWLIVALGLGLLGLYESRTPDAAAQRRAAVTRFSAGLVAVAGVALSVFREGSLGNGEYGRLLEPWIAEAAILAVSLVLVERAFRRDSSAFIGAAAIGLVTALTDFNFRYLTSSVDVGLLVEGLILIGAGLAADRLRRRIERSRGTPPDEPATIDAASAEAPLSSPS
jgi:hypothetical protein